MFKELEELSKKGTVVFGSCNSGGRKFCFWQPSNSFQFTSGLLEDIELNDYGYVADTLSDTNCVPFGLAKTTSEAYFIMRDKINKYFDEELDLFITISMMETILKEKTLISAAK